MPTTEKTQQGRCTWCRQAFTERFDPRGPRRFCEDCRTVTARDEQDADETADERRDMARMACLWQQIAA